MHLSDEDAMFQELQKMSTGYARTQELYTTVKLGIPDLLAGKPMHHQVIARELNCDPRALYRFMRLLVTRGILFEEESRFGLTDFGALLRSDHPGSLHNILIYIGEIQYQVGQEMLYSVQTGKPAFDKIFGMPFFEYLSLHSSMSQCFNDGMRSSISARMEGLVSGYDFSQASTIVDIGGGDGTLISHILKVNPDQKGILLEVSSVAEEARQNITRFGLSDRCQIITGDFFIDPLPSGCDIYILSNIIHDWSDEKAKVILHNCHRAMQENSKLLLVEQVIPEVVTPGSAAIGSDVSMLLLTGGIERSLEEFRVLLDQASLEITRCIPFRPTNIPAGREPSWAVIESAIGRR